MADDPQGFHLAHTTGGTPATSKARPSRITPRHVAIGVLGLVVLLFVFQNTDTVRLQFLTFGFDAPLWLMLLVIVAVSMAMGVLLGRRSARPKAAKKK